MLTALLLTAAPLIGSIAAPQCSDERTTCAPWERQWKDQKPRTGDVVTSDARLVAPTSLAGLRIQQSLSEAKRDYASRGRSLAKVNEIFTEPYAIYNLVDSEGRIFGNAGFCRDAVVNVNITIGSTNEYFKALKRYVSEFGQPTIKFASTPTDDDTTNFDNVVFHWATQNISLYYPVNAEDEASGAIMLENGQICR